MRRSTILAFALISVFSLVMVSCNNSKKDDKAKNTDTTATHGPIVPVPDTANRMHDTTGTDTTGKGEQRPPPQ
jgi:preprotein translocase subunit SecG